MWRLLGRALVGTLWYDLPMPHTAELLLADLDAPNRQRIWKDAAAHARATGGRIEMGIQIFLINAIYLVVFVLALRERVPLPHFARGNVALVLGWTGFLWAFYAVWNAVLGKRRAIRYVRNELTKLGRCPACGYDLCATPTRCPECGAVPTSRRSQST